MIILGMDCSLFRKRPGDIESIAYGIAIQWTPIQWQFQRNMAIFFIFIRNPIKHPPVNWPLGHYKLHYSFNCLGIFLWTHQNGFSFFFDRFVICFMKTANNGSHWPKWKKRCEDTQRRDFFFFFQFSAWVLLSQWKCWWFYEFVQFVEVKQIVRIKKLSTAFLP